GKVKDFSPYVQKIVASGADAVITGNWGADMIALAKAANDGGLKVPFYTYYAASDGVTAAIGAAGIDRIRLVHETHPGNPNPPKALSEYITGYRKLHPQNDVNQPRINTGLNMLAVAIKKAGSTDVDKVAQALEGLEYANLGGDQVIMRREDHQLQMPIYISVHTNKNIKHDLDASGFAYTLGLRIGFWPALILAPVLVGLLGALVERHGLRRVHRFGHVAELIFTFGVAILIEEIVQLVWGRPAKSYQIPAALDFPLFRVMSSSFPAYKAFMLVVAVAIFAFIFVILTRTRAGLIIQASLTHPQMVAMLGHNVPR